MSRTTSIADTTVVQRPPLATGVPRITAVSGPSSGRSMAMAHALASIGRHTTNDLVLEDQRVSGVHLEVQRVGDHVRVRDAGSTNGTWLGAHRVSERDMIDLQGIGQGHSGGDVATQCCGHAERPAPLGEHFFIADDHNPRRKITARKHQCKVRPDSRRLTAGDGNNRQTRAHGYLSSRRIST